MANKRENFTRRNYEVVEEVLDGETGELKRRVKKFTIKVKTENFYLTYVDNLSGFMCLTANTDKSVLIYLLKIAEYNTGRAFVSPSDRKDACNEMKIGSQQFSNSIRKLKELRLITGDNGFYMINPAIFWKGHGHTRKDLLSDNALAVQFNFEVETEDPKQSSEIPQNTNF